VLILNERLHAFPSCSRRRPAPAPAHVAAQIEEDADDGFLAYDQMPPAVQDTIDSALAIVSPDSRDEIRAQIVFDPRQPIAERLDRYEERTPDPKVPPMRGIFCVRPPWSTRQLLTMPGLCVPEVFLSTCRTRFPGLC
jgi:hypothetical protein